MELTFRFAGVDDLPAVSSLVNRAFRGESARSGWTHEADLLDGTRVETSLLIEEFERGASFGMVLRGERLVGCFRFEMKNEKTGYVGMIAVDPLEQNQGIGKRILEQANSEAQRRGAQALNLTVLAGRDELIAYYIRQGFSLTGKSEPLDITDERFGIPRLEKELVLLEMTKRVEVPTLKP